MATSESEDSSDQPSEQGSSDAKMTEEAKLPNQGKLAGIDFGTVRVGVAVCDPGQKIASPLEVYTRRSKDLDAKFFSDLAQAENLVGFVVGLPVHMSGDESQKSREAVEFGKWLGITTGLPVTWVDERFSTAAAREMLRGSKMSGKKKKAKLDQLAAQVLLSTYLDSPEAQIESLE